MPPKGKAKGKKKVPHLEIEENRPCSSRGSERELLDEPVFVFVPEPEPEPELVIEVQWTDTSYTSASLETPPPLPPEEPKAKVKKKHKKADEDKEAAQKTSSQGLFDWSAESIQKEEAVVEEEPAKKKPKKGKKGKKEEPKEEIPDFEKPKKWKSMNKKERDQWLAQRIEEWRAEKEAEKQAALAGAKEKKIRLAKERAELMARDNAEQEIRRDILQKTVKLFANFERQKIAFENQKQSNAEWAQYLRCDGLPDPRVVTAMSAYLNRWRETEDRSADQLNRRCKEALPMLEMLEEVVANSVIYTKRQAANYNEIRLQLRAQLADAIDFASYWLLRDVEKRCVLESIRLASYSRDFPFLKLNLWVAIVMPKKLPHPNDPPPQPVELSFPGLKVGVKLPTIVDASCICVRAARSLLDLLSEKSRSFAQIIDLPNKYQDLFAFNVKEHMELVQLKKDQDAIRSAFYKQIHAKIKEIENFIKLNPYAPNKDKEDELEQLHLTEPPFLPDPREHIGATNEKNFRAFLKKNFIKTRAGELNLRKYRITGGVLNLDLLTMPPQPKPMELKLDITTLELPKCLKPWKYQVQYRAPGPPPPGVTRTPEEIEAEMKKIEAEYEKLALVSIELPQEVMWAEPPVVCQWQEARSLWTSNYVNDYKYNEDKLTVQFRTGVLWPIGLATVKYSNLPFQGWDLRPDPSGNGVLLSVTGIMFTCSWIIHGANVKLKFVSNATTKALKANYNKSYTVKRMVQIMREAAVDFFPDMDSYNQVEGSCPKEWTMERHFYHVMAFLSTAYNFQWSKWNVEAGYRNIVIQFREAVDKKRESKLMLLHVNPQKASVLAINEHSAEFSLEPMKGMQFYPDLFTMNMRYASVDARRTVFDMTFKLVETVFAFLQELKLCSFS